MTDERLLARLRGRGNKDTIAAADRIEALTAELAKAVEAKQLASDAGPCVCFACLEARALLAEIEGEKT
jgi:guanylate kinase